MCVIMENCCKRRNEDELDKSLDKIIWNNEVMGLDMGFWVSIAVVIVVVILMNVIFWNMELTEK